MNRYQWSTLNTIKTFFGYRNQHYQSIAQFENQEINENTSCIEDHINRKEIDDILPLITTEKSLDINISSYTNDTRPDVDLLDC